MPFRPLLLSFHFMVEDRQSICYPRWVFPETIGLCSAVKTLEVRVLRPSDLDPAVGESLLSDPAFSCLSSSQTFLSQQSQTYLPSQHSCSIRAKSLTLCLCTPGPQPRTLLGSHVTGPPNFPTLSGQANKSRISPFLRRSERGRDDFLRRRSANHTCTEYFIDIS